jgi:hypothetical protein
MEEKQTQTTERLLRVLESLTRHGFPIDPDRDQPHGNA